MLRQILGKKIVEIELQNLLAIVNNRPTVLDLGCGDGLYSYRQALQNPDKLYLATDANSQVLQKISNKVQHEGLNNLIYLQHAAESLPLELNAIVDRLIILYPWGSLLKIVVEADQALENILRILKPNAKLEVIFTYSPEYEGSMISEYNLPLLNPDFIEALSSKLVNLNLSEISIIKLESLEIINQTSWGKKINSKRERVVWHLTAVKN